jgi:hypothetical protein
MGQTMTITVYVGDVVEDLAIAACTSDASAKLIDSTNYQNLSTGTYYTSIGDLNRLRHFGSILQQADNIFYIEPAEWSDVKIKYWTEDYLSAFFYAGNKVINGFQISKSNDYEDILAISDTRKTNYRQLWIAGCSISHGVGVGVDQTFGKLLSDHLQIPVSFLTRSGSSIKWQADQILRSDLKKGDILVWGLTAINRASKWENSILSHCTISSTKDHNILQLLNSDQMIYDAVTAIHQVLNFCAKVDCKIILASLLAHGIEPYINNCSNFIGLEHHFGRDVGELYADLGTDGNHPGPLMHQYYAEEIIKKYHNLYRENK